MRRVPDPTALRAVWGALLCILLAAPGIASDERWYKVELLVFTRDPVVTDEWFPPNPTLAYPDAARFLHYPERILEVEAQYPGRTSVDEFGRILVSEPPPAGAIYPPGSKRESPHDAPSAEELLDLPQGTLADEEVLLRPTPFVALTADFRELGAGALRLSRSGGATVHFHETWLQPIPERAEALPLVLDDSGDTGDWPELQGSVLIYRSRYLHIETDLWRNTEGNGLPEAFRAPAPPLGPARQVFDSFEVTLTPITVTATPWPTGADGMPLASSPRSMGPDYPYRQAVKFTERRRMRRNELHYVDHPAMGALIKITALDEDALESWAEAELMQADTWPASLTALNAR